MFLGNSSVRKVFGTALKEHLRITGKRIAYPLEICLTALSNYGMLEEGLFRVAGSSAKVKRLKLSIDSGCFSVLIPEYRDPHVLASLLKLYLRELPEPLLTYYLQKEWINAMQYQGTHRLETVKNIIEKLPQENKDNLTYLIQFLSKLSQHPENKMSASNIAIVLSPNLLWCKVEEESTNMGNCVLINMLIELFIKEADTLFPGDVSEYVNLSKLFHDEEVLKYNKINNDLKPESPKPNTRKKKSAPIPPNSLTKIGQDVLVKNYDISKFNKNMDNLMVNSSVDEDYLIKENSNENIAKDVTNTYEKPQSNYLEFVTHQSHIHEQDSQIHNLDRKEIAMNIQSSVKVHPVRTHLDHSQDAKRNIDSLSDSNNVSEIFIQDKPLSDNSKSLTITVSSHKIADNVENQLRQKNLVNRPKPEVPARPLSLTKKSSDSPSDPVFKKTHCSLYNVADRMQPSIINIRRESEIPLTKHDVQSVENTKMATVTDGNKSEIKSDTQPFCTVTTIKINRNRNESTNAFKTFTDNQNKTKSNEQLNCTENQYITNCDRRSSHMRAKSDGSIMDFEGENKESSYMQISPVSPRNLSKPTQPPPPPPAI